MVYTINDVKDRVQRQFGDESGVQIVTEDIVRWIGDAFREINTQNSGVKTRFIDVPIVANQQNYQGSNDTNDILAVYYRSESSSDFYLLEYLTTAEINNRIPGWNSGTFFSGDPVLYTRSLTSLVGRNDIAVFPIPDRVGGTLRISYNANLTPPNTNDSDLNAFIHESYHNYLLEYCLMKAYEMDENWEAADRKAQYIQSTLNVLSTRDNHLNNETYPVISTRPGDME